MPCSNQAIDWDNAASLASPIGGLEFRYLKPADESGARNAGGPGMVPLTGTGRRLIMGTSNPWLGAENFRS